MAHTIASCSGHSRPIRHIKWLALILSIKCAFYAFIKVLNTILVRWCWWGLATVASLVKRVRRLSHTAIIHVAKELSRKFKACVYSCDRCLGLAKYQDRSKYVKSESHV